MQALRQKDILILQYLDKQEPQGASLKEISIVVAISQQNAYRYLAKLILKNLVRKDTRRFYHIAQDASQNLKLFHVHDTPTQPKPLKPEPSQPAQATNLHAFEVHYLTFATEYTRLEAKLTQAKIPFKPSGNRKHPSYIIQWEGLRVRLGSRQIIAWGPELTEPITVKHEEIEGRALKANISTVQSLLHKTGIRAQETVDNRLYAQVYYRELAIINNAAIEKLHRNKGYLPIAWDRTTERATIWMDPTPSTAIETNKGKNHEVLRRWGQGVEDGVLDPYNDEMRHRREISEITSLLKDTNTTLKEYGVKLNAHLPVLEKMDVVLQQQIELNNKQLKVSQHKQGQQVL